ncbi:hypothetical protein [Planococcus faecalis]|uniref:hypothetical protein n=1 Tax=Planococcus faecalis TaxID=1598147 RepID=UPI0008D91885|nr:hypothetical protein [Planococcus faecalis]OHX51656.1 hypothetical protein BB777_15910 [Planococcus faecalis]
MIEMKEQLKQVLVFQQKIQQKMDRLIDRLSRTAIEQEERKFELMYDKHLSDKEKVEIKKQIIMKWAMVVIVPLLLLILTLLNKEVMM